MLSIIAPDRPAVDFRGNRCLANSAVLHVRRVRVAFRKKMPAIGWLAARGHLFRLSFGQAFPETGTKPARARKVQVSLPKHPV